VNAAESIKQKAILGGRRRYGSIQPVQPVQVVEPHDPAHGRAGGAESRCAAYHPRPSPTSGASLQVYKRAVRASEGPPRFIPRDGARRRGEGFQAFQASQASQASQANQADQAFQRPSMNSPPPFPHGQPRSHPLHPNDVSALARPTSPCTLTARQYQ